MGQQQEMPLPNQPGRPPGAGTHPHDPSVHSTKSYPDKNQYHQGHRDILETSDTTSIGTITSTFTHQDIE
eukprot:scaffold357203_cov87-Attheya_sp.AAC.1